MLEGHIVLASLFVQVNKTEGSVMNKDDGPGAATLQCIYSQNIFQCILEGLELSDLYCYLDFRREIPAHFPSC